MRVSYCLGLLLALLLGACGGRQSIVLVPDPDGRVGRAEVITAGGKRLLDKSGDMTQVRSRVLQPSAVSTAQAGYLAERFGEALAIEPPAPEKFVLYFETGTTVLKPPSHEVVNQIVAASQRRKAISIAISGHTDTAGSVQLNDDLARQRADFVHQLLTLRGAEFKRISVSSHGKGNPAVPTADGVAEPRNRRAEIIVY